ncbi:hypothetical protein [Leptospira stimsonii]|uniref:Lipoprotein n=1 Tax=Leptospira stimsonii TaxID=2202203 RepID=A0ABY2NAZ7_9LEPT|nr:hypothetical protein [Leptospira stimsonii]TGK10832.1 hypothetical protein EHO98_19855 [Leptospira stimsonii]TGM20349.1 hypothetical protein EHQ90_03360 [Leptospira stimsonii]
MKAKIIVLLIASFVMSACASADSAGKGLNDYQYSAGSYYVIQNAKNNYAESEKSVEPSSNVNNIYFDLLLFPINIYYFAFTGETLFGAFKLKSEDRFNYKIESLQSDPKSPLDPTLIQHSDPVSGWAISGDIWFAMLNIVYYPITGETLFRSIRSNTTIVEGGNRTALARDLLLASAQRKTIAITDRPFAFAQSEKGYYFTSDRIMNRFDAETFGQLLTDANLVLDDLDLASEDVEELKQNGYLDFVEDDAKSIPTFEAAPVKGKKK